MADEKQIGSLKRMHFGDKVVGNHTDGAVQCAECETMLTDALDGALTAEQQERMDAHVAECGMCSQMLADARRGAAWLEMLRMPRPEPPLMLQNQILAVTSGAQEVQNPGRTVSRGVKRVAFASAFPGQSPRMSGVAASYGNVLPFHVRATAAVRTSSLGQIALQPRFAMTAAMAFFSIALTMNLTGVHPMSLRASDLRPSALKRNFTDADARVVRYYEGLRVVYELESRVHDFEGASDNYVPADSQSVPTSPNQPAIQSPSAQPGSGSQKDDPPADRNQTGRKKSTTNPGTSHKEEIYPSRRLIGSGRSGKSYDNQTYAYTERVMA